MKQEHGDIAAANELVRTLTGTEVESSGSAVWQAVTRPVRVFFGSVVLQIMSLFGAVGFTFFYVMSTTLPDILKDQFGLGEAQTGLAFISFSVGSIIGIIVCNLTVDRIYIKMSKGHEGKAIPEYRLPLLIFGACLLPLSVVLYGWAAQYHVQWAVPLLGTLLVGIGMLAAFMCVSTYLIDAFSRYAASGMAANTVLRSIFGAVFPLFGLQMYSTLGLGWGNSLIFDF